MIKKLIKIIKIIIKYIILKKNINKYCLKKNIETMGPIFIKFGQILSTRNDIINKEYTNELKKLQTNNKPIHFNKIKKNINLKFKKYIKKINENPISTASISQVHTGITKDNKLIVIKILKPGIKKEIKKDIKIIKLIIKIINLNKKFKRLKLNELVNELEINLNKEINIKYEAANLTKMKNFLKKNDNIYIPKIFWDISDENVITTEYIDGINILNKKKLNTEKINLKNISRNIINFFFSQAFKNKFFHADMHPGNLLISKCKERSILVLIDFGIVSIINKKEAFYLAENILAFTKNNYKKIVQLHLNARTIKTKKTLEDIENELIFTFEPILNKKIKDIDFKKTIISLISISKKFNMQVQPNFILFQKTLLNIESICRNISPSINMWKESKKSLEKNIAFEIFKNKINNKIKNNKKINYKDNINEFNTKKIINLIFSKKIYTFTIGYIIGIIILIIFLKYNQNLMFLL